MTILMKKNFPPSCISSSKGSILSQNGIMHRNLKLDNLMLRYDSPDITKMETVIIGFHLADYTKGSTFNKCGTPGYTAPEILNMKEGSE
jgi:serine/threonine protein kinase